MFSLGAGGIPDVEAFGQSEALTKRIARILEQYPDGPNILSELIQNADDAGAARVRVLYNHATYGTETLFSPNMAKWQGPAIYCFNDAEFSDSDFLNLARIGQGSKLQRASTTGRFGLGFNSVYHFTDLPTIVSANSIVMFDPHATNLPGISAANPGLRIRFVNSPVVSQFPDQFAPIEDVFGCDLQSHFHGTMFRFPLRTPELAEESDIKHRAYSRHEVANLFRRFRASISETMLFLRNIRSVEVYVQYEVGQEPFLLFGTDVAPEDDGGSWKQIDAFVRGEDATTTGDLLSKRNFYARLSAKPEEELPSITQVVRISTTEQQELADFFSDFEADIASASARCASLATLNSLNSSTAQYLVCNRIGGGRAREMACAPENVSLKLIPWAGIAGRIDGVATDGRAFCFLPLPVRVGLPVHVNGYFELSSNRRDVWHGDDMTGEGKLRSEWNASLLVDAVAPAYITFLLAAQELCREDIAQYLALFPTRLPTQPWEAIVHELFRRMKHHPVFVSHNQSAAKLPDATSTQAHSRCAIAPSECVVIDDTIPQWELLENALTAAGYPTVLLPEELRKLAIQLDTVKSAMTPTFFRDLIRDGQLLPRLNEGEVRRVIEFCLQDCSDPAAVMAIDVLDELPIVPLKDGTYGQFIVLSSTEASQPKQQRFYLASPVEAELLASFPSVVVKSDYRPLFDALQLVFERSNLGVADIETIVTRFLPRVLGGHFKETKSGVFVIEEQGIPNNSASVKKSPCHDWLCLLWQFIETTLGPGADLPEGLKNLPLLPVALSSTQTGWIRPSSGFGVVIRQEDATSATDDNNDPLIKSFGPLGVYVVDSTVVNGDKSIQWLLRHKLAQKLTPGGVLASLECVQVLNGRRGYDYVFSQSSAADRLALCNFLSSSGMGSIPESCEPILFDLPVFLVHSGVLDVQSDNPAQQFVCLRRGGYIPDATADTRLLDSNFFRADSEVTRKFLRDCGADEWSHTKILLDYVFPRLKQLESADPSLVDETLVAAFSSLPFHQKTDTRFRAFMQSQAIIPSRKRVFRRVNELHDPNSKELSMLVGENSLPAEAFAAPEIVDILKTLGLRMGLSCHAVLESARSVEAMYVEGSGVGDTSQAWEKATNLVSVVNKHFDTMAAALHQEEKDTRDGCSLRAIIDGLREIRWLPVWDTPSDPLMPWKASPHANLTVKRLSSPARTRPRQLAWFCSSALDILEGELASQELVSAFEWDQPIDAHTLALQIIGLAGNWDREATKHHDSSNGSTTPGAARLRRFPLPEVRQLYEMLDRHCGADEEEWRASQTFHDLSRARWIWTGKVFASVSQIAFSPKTMLEPLLFSMPSETIIPRALLESFSPKETFEVLDYLQAMARLPQHVVVDAEVASACLKMFSLLQEEDLALITAAVEALAPENVLLLDESNRLVPAMQLTFEDMEWNESVEVRQGTAFVRKDISNDVAAALGAISLHSKLAETSVRSRHIVCPSAWALCSILQATTTSWHHALLNESLLAAERAGASQLHLFVDYRHHPAQKVLQPSFQQLQNEALCIHLEGVVLSEHDVNALFRGEGSRTGLLCGFFASDCMQILSGNAFYVLDPSGSFLASPTSAAASSKARTGSSHQQSAAHGAGRQYDLLGSTFRQYSDQLLPFIGLPTCQGNVMQGMQSTLIRFPWRTSESPLSKLTMTPARARKLVSYLKAQLYQALVFTESVHRISVWSLGIESEFARHCHGEVALENAAAVLRKRVATQRNEEWKRKKFSFQSFFKSAVTPENQMEFSVQLELENTRHRDTWLLSDNIGAGRSRDLACSTIHETLQSTPYVSVACHLFRDGNPAPRLRGKLFKLTNTAQAIGLPVHVNGCFKTQAQDKQLVITATRAGGAQSTSALSGSELAVKAQWNRVLLEDGVVAAYLKLLLAAKRQVASGVPKMLYNIWPSLQQVGESDVGLLLQSLLYRQLGDQELFLCGDGQFRSLSSGYLLDTSGMDMQVASFARLHFPALDMPKRILSDCTSLLPSRVRQLTPHTMRRALRNIDTSGMHANVCLSLLEYCLSDLPSPLPVESHPVWSEFNGLSLLPLEDGSIGVIRVNQRNRYVLATFNQIELLSPLRQIFVALAAQQRLHRYFSDSRFTSVLGLTAFSIKVLADNLERRLPKKWKNQASVAWDPTAPDEISRLWLYRFWQEVHYDHRSLTYFAAWPLVPVKGLRLVSCGKADAAACVWLESGDATLAQEVTREFADAVAAHDAKLAELDSEHKRLKDLATMEQQLQADGQDDSAEELDMELSDGDASDESDGEEVADDTTDANVSGDAATISVVEIEELSCEAEAQVPSRSGHDEGAGDAGAGVGSDGMLTASQVVMAFEETGEDVVEQTEGPSENGQGGDAVTADIPAMDAFCSRETLHEIFAAVGLPLLELAFFAGQESEIVLRGVDVTTSLLDAVYGGSRAALSSNLLDSVFGIPTRPTLAWDALSDDQVVLLVEYFSLHGDIYGGYSRSYVEKLKQLPVYLTSSGARTAVSSGNFYLVPPEIDLATFPLPASARQWFLQSIPRLHRFYKELGVEEVSDAKLLQFVLPQFGELDAAQGDVVLALILDKWATLRGNAELVELLKHTPLLREAGGDTLQPVSSFFDPRNKFLSAIYEDIAGQPLAARFQTPEWLSLLGEIGLRTELSVDMFLECARRVDALCAAKRCLSSADERLVVTLHQFFVQHFDKFDRSRTFFDAVASVAFVPALVYEDSSAQRPPGAAASSRRGVRNFAARLIVCTYAECVTPDDQALAFTTMPVLHGAAIPPRVLWSRLGVASPPPKHKVLAHLAAITQHEDSSDSLMPSASPSLDWQFFIPVVSVFQEIFKYLQAHWAELSAVEQQHLADAAVIPVGSDLVKGSRLFFHLAENLAPLMFEVPRVFGAYDTLFRHLGSKDTPAVEDYVHLLHDLRDECRGNALSLNELLAVGRIANLLADALAEAGSEKLHVSSQRRIFLPSTASVMQPLLRMAHNDAPWLSARIDLTELHLVHPRLSLRCCQLLRVPPLSAVVTEEIDASTLEAASSPPAAPSPLSDDIAHMNAVLPTAEFADALRRIITAQQQKAAAPSDAFGAGPDFEKIDRRIVALGRFEVKEVDAVRSRFIAHVGMPSRAVDVTKAVAGTGSLSFVDESRRAIYVGALALREHRGVRVGQLVASCINQMLGGIIQDCAPIESALRSDVAEIDTVLELLNITEDPTLIAEKLRGVLGEPLTASDCENVELAPLRSCLPGELVAVDHEGALRYAKVLESRQSAAEVSCYHVRLTKEATEWLPASEIFFFRSGRVGGGASRVSSTPEALARAEPDSALGATLPNAVVTISSSAGEEVATAAAAAPSAPVASANIVSAVNDLLSRLNVSLDTSFQDLVEENRRLQLQLELTEESRRIAAAQIDEAIREKRDVLDSLVCAICLEARVNRVLVPCGHIYCGGCVDQLRNRRCPLCRCAIAASTAFHVPS